MFSICARIDSKKSDGNFGSNAVGIIVTEENLELKSPEEIAAKADELFRVAREAVERQACGDSAAKAPEPPLVPSNGNGSNGNGTHPSGNGNGRRYGRPQDSPSPKQRAFLAKLARERKLGPESIKQTIERLLPGRDPKHLTRQDMSMLIEALLAAGQAA
ncbi:MAG: hypothetical protein L6R43_02865 [Planctomycetes bacterium]|nr:hypothetical protein [Planctomycetota bacterium]